MVGWYGWISEARAYTDVSGEFGSIHKRADGLSFPHRCHPAHCLPAAASSRLQLPVQAHHFEGGRGDFLIHHEHERGGQNCLEQLGLQAFIQTKEPILPAKKR